MFLYESLDCFGKNTPQLFWFQTYTSNISKQTIKVKEFNLHNTKKFHSIAFCPMIRSILVYRFNLHKYKLKNLTLCDGFVFFFLILLSEMLLEMKCMKRQEVWFDAVACLWLFNYFVSVQSPLGIYIWHAQRSWRKKIFSIY